MATQSITIELPDPLMRIAAATHQPIEALVTQSILSNLPPSTDNAPPELQADILAMQTLSTEELYEIAQAHAEPEVRDRQADHLMLRKAYAWSLIRWRGHQLPALKDLPTPA